MAKTLLSESGLPKGFCIEVVNTYYIQNCVFIRPILKKIPCELWKEGKPNFSYFHVFNSESYVQNIKDKLSKFDPKANKGFIPRIFHFIKIL